MYIIIIKTKKKKNRWIRGKKRKTSIEAKRKKTKIIPWLANKTSLLWLLPPMIYTDQSSFTKPHSYAAPSYDLHSSKCTAKTKLATLFPPPPLPLVILEIIIAALLLLNQPLTFILILILILLLTFYLIRRKILCEDSFPYFLLFVSIIKNE